MTLSDFLRKHRLLPEQIQADHCLRQLLSHMEAGLRGEGNIPMLPSYLSASIVPPKNATCCVLDAGGTNLRAATAVFDQQGICTIQNLTQVPMPGTLTPLSREELYQEIANMVQFPGPVGFCFSYNVQMTRQLDGILLAWCKEVQVPDAVGHPVGVSLKTFLDKRAKVHVLNDSVAAMLGAKEPVSVGIILGTGINVCYEEPCRNIPKVEDDLQGSMIISTEVGEFDGIPKSDLDLMLFQSTEDPGLAHGEKQCAGGYLGDLICLAWQTAAKEGLLLEHYQNIRCSLPEISSLLENQNTDPAAVIAAAMIHRAAKIAAILCAGPILRCAQPGTCIPLAVEGSQFAKLWSFREHFTQELSEILAPYAITFRFIQSENACLRGAALAAFAQPM